MNNQENEINDTTLQERINWSLKKPDFIIKNIPADLSKKEKNKLQNIREVNWGRKMINSPNNKQWTTNLGEQLVKDVLIKLGKNPIRPNPAPLQCGTCKPDWETDEYIYEVKTRSWTTDGTAGEKVLGTPYKYADVPILYNKPLKIVCVAYQEYEFTYGNTRIFNNPSERQLQILDFFKNLGIEYIKFSYLVSNLNQD